MSSINFNHSNKPQKMFFGEFPSLQRYDVVRYPKFEQLYNLQTSYFWNPQEISLAKDVGDFQSLSDNEKHIFSSNLKYQILLDSVQSRSVLEFLPVVSNSELESLIIIWSFFEQIHSKSYSHIIRSIYPDSSVIFDSTLSTPEIVNRAKTVTKYYDEFVTALSQWNVTTLPELLESGNQTSKTQLYELKRLLYLAIVNVSILEGIRFYTSFACSFAFAENKKMIGNSDIISLIGRDEACYIAGTEILTPTGWKILDNVTLDDEVLQYNKNGTVEFVNPTAVIHNKHNSGLYKFKEKSGHFEQIVTYDHRMIYRNHKTHNIEESLSQDTVLSFGKDIISTGMKLNGRNNVTAVEMLNILYLYYGSIVTIRSTDTHTACKFIIYNDFRLLFMNSLAELKISVQQKDIKSENKYTHYTVLIPKEYLIPNFDWVNLKEISYICARNIIEWCQKFGNDSTVRTDRPRLRIYNRNVLVKLQQLSTISGWAHRLFKRSDGGVSIEIDKAKDSYVVRSCPVQIVDNYNGMVHCVSVPSGMIVIRYNGLVSVGGNCHLQISENIIKHLKTDEDADMQDIIKNEVSTVEGMYSVAVEEEMEWANYLFKYGAILGLNSPLLHNYIKFMANRRMRAIGMNPLYNVGNKNPLPWMDNYLKSGNIVVAPQESELTSYLINASNPDINENTFKGFVL